jgi:hypothetical protein
MSVVRLRLTPVGETMFPLVYGLQDEGSRRGIVQPHTPRHMLTCTRARA